MKVSELMVGDWVSYCGFYNKVIYIGQKVSMYNGKGIEFTIDPEYIRPIPLTEDILVKNGFTIDKGYAICQLAEDNYLDFYLFEHRLRRAWEIVDEWNNHAKVRDLSFVCQCHYVHEFQHALRLCGVEKEIEL